jgi:eukaryotic-like serine/threonine-protein kinase
MHDHFDLSPAQWHTLRRLLDEALSRQGEDRQRWLDSLAGAEAAFRPRLNALLAHADSAAGHTLFDTLPKIETGQFAPLPGAAAAGMPERIGSYRLIRELGSGGMASVWLAERTDMLQGRQVALKLPHGAWKRAGLAERLEREREILATLEHPNIARLYDAGVAGDGQPWLALEYVAGERIDAWSDRHALDVPARLRLFLQVARAVAHAHANLVVHRDLKPGNILVTDAGEVKLLDFGIAKLLDQGVARETDLTQQAGRALTPDYAAPEQILGRPVGTAADVYALGVVLYELLAGQRPYVLRRDSLGALEDAILQADIAAPSTCAPPARRKALRGDIDTIVLKALKREPAERYATVAALVEDIERCLAYRPVLAQPDGAMYRLGRFVRRNRLPVAGSMMVALALSVGAGVASWQAVQARAEQRRAQEVLDFVTSIFRDADPSFGGQQPPSAAELLDRARTRVDVQSVPEEATRVELLNVLAESFIGLEDLDRAGSTAQAALEAASRSLGDDHVQVLRARAVLTRVHRTRGDLAAMREQTELRLRALQHDPRRAAPHWLQALIDRAELALDQGRYEDAERSAREALGWMDRWSGDWALLRAAAWHAVSNALEFRLQIPAATDAAERAYEYAKRAHPGAARHPQIINERMVLARLLAIGDRFREGLALHQQSVDDAETLWGPSSGPLAQYLQGLAVAQARAGDLDAARRSIERALPMMEKHFGADSGHAGAALDALAFVHFTAREPLPAIALYDRSLRIVTRVYGERGEPAFPMRMRRAASQAWLGRLDEALPELRRLADDYARHGRGSMARPWHHLGIAERLAGRPAEALAMQQRALGAVRDGPQAARERIPLRAEMAIALVELGRHDEALAQLDALLPEWDRQSLAATPARIDAAVALGRAQLATGRLVPARETLEQAAEYWRQRQPGSRWAREAEQWLARAEAAGR